MKTYVLFLSALLLSTNALAQAGGGVVQTPPVSPKTVSLVLHRSDDGNRYFLVFSARGDTSTRKSMTGHAFISWGIEDHISRTSSYRAYGMYPKDDSFTGSIKSLRPVAGKVIDEDTMHSVLAATDSLIVEVSKKDYDLSLAQAERLANSPFSPPFQLLKQDCVTFIDLVAVSIGLNTPGRNINTLKPQAYVRELMRTATAPVTISGPWGSYTGQTSGINGLPEGQGTFRYRDGSQFTGEVDMGKPKNGTMTYPTGNSYNGPFDGALKRNGRATFTWKNGSKFEGAFKDDELATGKITLPDGTSLTGSFHDGHVDGQGSLRLPNGDRLFDGTFESGLPTAGTFFLKNGTTASGALKNARLQGQVTIHFPDSNNFEGTFENGSPTQGTFTWKDGSKQTGPLKNGAFEGPMRYVRPDGTRYEGDWKDGHAEGQGTLFRADGSQVTGTWKNGHLDGGHAKVRGTDGHERAFSPQDSRGDEKQESDGGWLRAWDKDGRVIQEGTVKDFKATIDVGRGGDN